MKTIYPTQPAHSFDEWGAYVNFQNNIIECKNLLTQINLNSMKEKFVDKYDDIKKMKEKKILDVAKDFIYNKNNSTVQLAKRNSISERTVYRIINYCFKNGIFKKLKENKI